MKVRSLDPLEEDEAEYSAAEDAPSEVEAMIVDGVGKWFSRLGFIGAVLPMFRMIFEDLTGR